MRDLKVERKISKFIDKLENSDLVWSKIRKLEYFGTGVNLHLDIDKLKGERNVYRLRIGDIRIIFKVGVNDVRVNRINYRGKIYK